MAAISEWLQIMLGEIARKREDLERARDEEAKRGTENTVDPATAAHETKVKRAS